MDRVFGACDDRVKLYGLGKCVDRLVADTEMVLDDFRCIPEGKRRLSLGQQHKHRLSIPLSALVLPDHLRKTAPPQTEVCRVLRSGPEPVSLAAK